MGGAGAKASEGAFARLADKSGESGTSKANKQGDAWVYVPKGTCEKLVDGSLQAKKA